ncbi:MAG TPA: hypothetical protein VNJ11_01015 [Bryobacteraceae bacterium]|nr:hypothetical protein [Bryobacteraceae bacterium]
MGFLLRSDCADAWCHFCAPAGARVTLAVVGTAGSVRFASVRYGETELVAGPAVEEVSFDVRPGRNVLTAVYVFSHGAEGRGRLCERSPDGRLQVLEEDLRGDNEVRGHRICGV